MDERNISRGGLIAGGFIAILFGVLLLSMPSVTLLTLVTLFAIFAVVYGLGMIVSAITREQGENGRMPLIVGGMLSVLAGIVAFVWPQVSLLILLYIIAFRAIIVGVTEIYASYQIRKGAKNEMLLGVVGVVNILLGVFLLFSPAIGYYVLLFVLGWYAVLVGIAYVIEGFMLPSSRGHSATAH